MKKTILLVALAFTMTLNAQNTWSQFDKLMNNGSYKSAYALAEGVFNKSTVSAERLAAAYHMTLAAARYQEDVRDSAEARYRDLLPHLEPLEQALCHAFLGEYDSALAFADVLKQTPVEQINMYCEGNKTQNVTPTAYDVIVVQAQSQGDYTPQQRVEMQRALLAFHSGDGDNLRLWHELRLLDLLDEVPNHPLTVKQVEEVLDRYRSSKSSAVTNLYFRLAHYYNGKEDYVTALRYCDTAIAMAPKSEGGIECANLRGEITMKYVGVKESGLWVIPDQVSLQRVRYRNLSRLWWRIVKYTDDYNWNEKVRAKLLEAKALESGEWSVKRGENYQYAESYVTLPALKTGQYLLLVSPTEDFKTDGFMVYEVKATEMLLLQDNQAGQLLDRRTGAPIAGQELRVERRGEVKATAVTDANGRYRFDYHHEVWSDLLVVERNGYRLQTRYSSRVDKDDNTMRLQAVLRTDRPIYKPGDTVQLALTPRWRAWSVCGLNSLTPTVKRSITIPSPPTTSAWCIRALPFPPTVLRACTCWG